jgi:hypothetical protein
MSTGKEGLNYLLVCFFSLTVTFVSCVQGIEAGKIVYKEGVYFNENGQPITGNAIYRFPTNEHEISIIRRFKNGVPISSEYFGYDHELISVDTLLELPKNEIIDLPLVRKVVLVHLQEDLYSTFSILVLIQEGETMTGSKCQQIFDAVVNAVKSNNSQLKLPRIEAFHNNLEIKILTGEYETPICSMEYFAIQ